MSNDFQKLQLCGAIRKIAETELGACFEGDESEKVVENIYRQYIDEGNPRNKNKWIREKLEPLFVCINERPVWLEPRPKWPWFDDKPMVFLQQFRLEQNEKTEKFAVGGITVYVFGARVNVQEGWFMKYTVVEQHDDLAQVGRSR